MGRVYFRRRGCFRPRDGGRRTRLLAHRAATFTSLEHQNTCEEEAILTAQRSLVQRVSFEPNPALVKHARKRAESVQNRIADRITAFAGSMAFVYLHILWFGSWIAFGVEGYPYGLLTMIVSLEAIFLSTFVMISQNRADTKRQVVADLQWRTVQEEDKQNQQLLDLSHQILELTKAVHAYATAREEGQASAD
jgi:uncharacterized membrane protein